MFVCMCVCTQECILNFSIFQSHKYALGNCVFVRISIDVVGMYASVTNGPYISVYMYTFLYIFE